MNRGAWQTPVHGVAKSRKQVNDWAHRSVLYITWYKFFIRCMIYNIFSHSCGSEGKAFALNVGDLGLIPGSGRSPGEGNGNPLQYSCLENPIDWGSWWATVQAVAKSQTWLSDFTFTSHSVGYFFLLSSFLSFYFLNGVLWSTNLLKFLQNSVYQISLSSLGFQWSLNLFGDLDLINLWKFCLLCFWWHNKLRLLLSYLWGAHACFSLQHSLIYCGFPEITAMN